MPRYPYSTDPVLVQYTDGTQARVPAYQANQLINQGQAKRVVVRLTGLGERAQAEVVYDNQDVITIDRSQADE